jgi:hypothetical protein
LITFKMATKTIFQLDTKPTWFENIAVRPKGTLLVTRLDVPELWEIDPVTGSGKSILSIPNVKSLTGINELKPDVWAIGAGDYDMAAGAVLGSWELWTADLSGPGEPKVKLGAKVPEFGLLNGTATWDEHTVLAADSPGGKIYKIDLTTGTSSVCLEDELMLPPSEGQIPLGVNGVKIFGKYVYFSNTAKQSFCRVPVDTDAKATGPVEVVAEGFLQDDFVLTEDGSAYIVTHPTNTVVKVSPAGETVKIAGEYTSTEVMGGTACAVGRTEEDKNVLYACTSGGVVMPVNGVIEPAKVVAIKLT